MNREIKFRAWDEKHKLMVWNPRFDVTAHPDGSVDYRAGTKTLMQYTGLKDKNGKEIYEGDVVKTHPGTDKRIKFLDTVEKIEFREGSFIVQGITILGQWNELSKEIHRIEIIGNIYENPELIRSLKGDE